MATYDVTFQRPDFRKRRSAWSLVDDVCDGQEAVKAGRRTHLPQPNPEDTSTENQTRYDQYLSRAVFYNVTGRTLQGLIGAAFRKVPTITVPASLSFVEDDIDGAGVSVYQQSQSVLAGVLKKGRHFVLVDYPQTDGVASRADMDSGRIRPTVASYPAESVINWRADRVGAVLKLSLVVIYELIEVPTSDGYGIEEVEQYRVLRLRDGVYTQELWRGTERGFEVFQTETIMRDGSGSPWDHIPGIFVGSENNDPSIDGSPLYDLAELNIAHYRNSADYEDSAFFCGQPQVYMSGLNEHWLEMIEEKGIYFGSRAILPLPVDGSAGILQAQPNTLAKEAMDQKENQMISIGARLIEPGSATKTATEAQSENEAQHSVLSLAVSNVSEAYTRCLEWMGRFMNVSGEFAYEINQEFTRPNLDAPLMTALVAYWQTGEWPRSEMRRVFRKYGLLDTEKTDEELDEELESNPPALELDQE